MVTASNFSGFLTTVVDLLKSSADFRERLGTYHDADFFVDPGAVTEAEAVPFIWGIDNAFFHALADSSHPDRKTATSLMPFAEISNQQHVETNPSASCGEAFTQLSTAWKIVICDHARNADSASIVADPLASMKDFVAWTGGILENFKAENANAVYAFDSISIGRVARTAPLKRGEFVDYWFAEFDLVIDSGS